MPATDKDTRQLRQLDAASAKIVWIVREDAFFCLRIGAVQPQKSQSDAARLKTASQKDNTSLKAQRAREFKSKGILLCVFALVCLIFYVACSTATCAQRSNKDQGQDQEEEKEEQEEEEEANEEEETAKKCKENDQCFSTRKL